MRKRFASSLAVAGVFRCLPSRRGSPQARPDQAGLPQADAAEVGGRTQDQTARQHEQDGRTSLHGHGPDAHGGRCNLAGLGRWRSGISFARTSDPIYALQAPYAVRRPYVPGEARSSDACASLGATSRVRVSTPASPSPRGHFVADSEYLVWSVPAASFWWSPGCSPGARTGASTLPTGFRTRCSACCCLSSFSSPAVRCCRAAPVVGAGGLLGLAGWTAISLVWSPLPEQAPTTLCSRPSMHLFS